MLLGNAILCLDEHTRAQDALRADPAAIPRKKWRAWERILSFLAS
jgi:hypothetical protein